MIDRDEIAWIHANNAEAHQAALVESMKAAQELDEYKIKCVAFVKKIKELRGTLPGEHWGYVVDELLNIEEL